MRSWKHRYVLYNFLTTVIFQLYLKMNITVQSHYIFLNENLLNDKLVFHNGKEMALNKMDSVDMNWDSNDTNDLDLIHGNSFSFSEYASTHTTLTNNHKDPPLFVGTYVIHFVLIYLIITQIQSNCFNHLFSSIFCKL